MLFLRKVLDAAVGVKLVDDPDANLYPMPLTATGQYDVEVRVLGGGVVLDVVIVVHHVEKKTGMDLSSNNT